MWTSFPTTNISEFSWHTVFNTGPEYGRELQYFHYTNLDNRELILKDDCIDLRLTRADCFADKQEMLHVIPIIEDVCVELLNRGQIDRKFYSTIKQSTTNVRHILEKFRKFYVFCLSANGDSSFLKENYACKGRKNGVIIGMHGVAFEDLQFYVDKEEEKSVDGIYMYDVIYDKEELHDGFYRIIKTLYKLRYQGAANGKAIKRTLGALITYGLVYKPFAFDQEEETRLIVDLPKLTLAKDKYYQDDARYLHIKLPIEALYDEVIVNV